MESWVTAVSPGAVLGGDVGGGAGGCEPADGPTADAEDGDVAGTDGDVLPDVLGPAEVVGVAVAVGVVLGVGVPGRVGGRLADGEEGRAEADALGVI